jgi:hypothetical protein
MRRLHVEHPEVAVAAVLVVAAVGFFAFNFAADYERYVIGPPGWVEASFGGIYYSVGIVISVVALVVAALVGGGEPWSARWNLRLLLVLSVIALWGGCTLGTASSRIAGPSVRLPGTIRYDFGTPVGSTVEATVICTSVVGDRSLIAEIRPDEPGLPSLVLRNVVRRDLYPTLVPPSGGPAAEFPVPNATPGLLGAYYWNPSAFDDQGASGRLTFVGQRRPDVLLAAPPPEAMTVDISWTCGGP